MEKDRVTCLWPVSPHLWLYGSKVELDIWGTDEAQTLASPCNQSQGVSEGNTNTTSLWKKNKLKKKRKRRRKWKENRFVLVGWVRSFWKAAEHKGENVHGKQNTRAFVWCQQFSFPSLRKELPECVVVQSALLSGWVKYQLNYKELYRDMKDT